MNPVKLAASAAASNRIPRASNAAMAQLKSAAAADVVHRHNRLLRKDIAALYSLSNQVKRSALRSLA